MKDGMQFALIWAASGVSMALFNAGHGVVGCLIVVIAAIVNGIFVANRE